MEAKTSFYVASSLDNTAAVKALIATLTAHGWECTYDWTTHGSVEAERERWGEVGAAEATGVMHADVVIVLQPGRRGTHVELGIALGFAEACESEGYTPLEIHLVGEHPEPRTCVFYYHYRVNRHTSIETLLAVLLS